MATLSVTQLSGSAGVTNTLASASTSDEFADDGSQRTFLEVLNGSGGSINATIEVQKPGPHAVPGIGMITAADIVIAVGAGVRKILGPFSQAYINQATGRVNVTLSSATSVTVGAFKIAKEG
mgnify:CR=1 FL=1